MNATDHPEALLTAQEDLRFVSLARERSEERARELARSGDTYAVAEIQSTLAQLRDEERVREDHLRQVANRRLGLSDYIALVRGRALYRDEALSAPSTPAPRHHFFATLLALEKALLAISDANRQRVAFGFAISRLRSLIDAPSARRAALRESHQVTLDEVLAADGLAPGSRR